MKLRSDAIYGDEEIKNIIELNRELERADRDNGKRFQSKNSFDDCEEINLTSFGLEYSGHFKDSSNPSGAKGNSFLKKTKFRSERC